MHIFGAMQYNMKNIYILNMQLQYILLLYVCSLQSDPIVTSSHNCIMEDLL